MLRFGDNVRHLMGVLENPSSWIYLYDVAGLPVCTPQPWKGEGLYHFVVERECELGQVGIVGPDGSGLVTVTPTFDVRFAPAMTIVELNLGLDV